MATTQTRLKHCTAESKDFGRYLESCYVTQSDLRKGDSSWYNEVMIANMTTETIYILDQTGIAYEVPPRFSYPAAAGDIVFHKLVRNGILAEYDSHQTGKKPDPNRQVLTNTVTIAELNYRPVYLPDFGITVSKPEHLSQMITNHPSFNENAREDALNEIINSIYSKGSSVFEVIATSIDPKIEYLYVGINGCVSQIKVVRSLNQDDRVTIIRNNAGNIDRADLEPKQAFSPCEIITHIEGMTFVVGTDRGRVNTATDELNIRMRHSYTREEVDIEIRKATDELKIENERLKEEIRVVKESLRVETADHKNTKADYELLIKDHRRLHEIHVNDLKLETERLKKQSQEAAAFDKRESDARKEELELRKATIAARSSVASDTATTVKAAAVVVPVIAAAATAAVTLLKSDNEKSKLGTWSFIRSMLPLVSKIAGVTFSPVKTACDLICGGIALFRTFSSIFT